jgi:ATP-dependent Lon protease
MNEIINKKDNKKPPDINPPDNKNDLINLVDKKLLFFQDIIQKTIIHVQKNKMLDILGISEVNNCIQLLNQISEKMHNLLDNIQKVTPDAVISGLQTINNELSGLFKAYGTDSLDDLLSICFGNNQSLLMTPEEYSKYEIMKKYFHPTGYKVVLSKHVEEESSKNNNKSVQMEDSINDKMKNLDCFDIFSTVKSFHMKVYGMKVYLYHSSQKKNLLVYGFMDDVIMQFYNNPFITNISKTVFDYLPYDIVSNKTMLPIFQEFFRSLSLKDFLIHSHQELYQKFFGIMSQFKALKQKSLPNILKEFIQNDLFVKRNTLMQLLINANTHENKYIAYLLYDLLSNDANGSVDTVEQTILFDSFPWTIKDSFRDAMKKTIQYTNDLSSVDINKIPLEQQICLMKAPDSVKEKAIIKMKEIKSKTDDSGSKARQYLDGLLKIPFKIFKREKIMDVMDGIKSDFQLYNANSLIPKKDNYTGAEIMKIVYSKSTNVKPAHELNKCNIEKCHTILKNLKRNILENIAKKINELVVLNEKKITKIKIFNMKKDDFVNGIYSFLKLLNFNADQNKKLLEKACEIIFVEDKNQPEKISTTEPINKKIESPNSEPILKKFEEISDYIGNIKKTLDEAIYGHNNAKKQIERIIGQWINGEQDGYCFGFEGPPGTGKTSLAKRGLSNCLKDEDGNGRPFAMIQMGGDSNGSTLHGHNYTYVGSTWGGIVQILIDKKCMNPIIFIDEIDKISRTEHGREIIGILTHLLDPTQNDIFQDKYFSGIDLDLSKALFILSYNDVECIDKILLDRIHRVKFASLSLEDKLEIAKIHMLPEIYKKMGMEGLIHFSPEVLTSVIEEYTSEPGVRKLREILFEIIGEINLDILKNKKYDYTFPINISISDIKTNYFKDKHEVKIKKVHEENTVGIINGLWANALGKGGVIPVQAKFYPSDKFLDLKLTGMQGDVMKESMNVALTLAWTLTSMDRREQINEMYNQPNISKYGVHIHCPEGAVPKDGPSAGTAITTVIYSILNNRKIRCDMAITGEISLDGKVTEIGGLDIKINGGIKAGVKEFIYPLENKKDFDKFMEKYKDSDLIKGIKFHPVSEIAEVFELIFE